jgi:uncharacterized protein (TIGR02647 family)
MYPKQQLDAELLEEVKLLRQYSIETLHEGIKIHSSAGETCQLSAERLFKKGIISQVDGGYLTQRGQEVVEHLDALINLLRPN